MLWSNGNDSSGGAMDGNTPNTTLSKCLTYEALTSLIFAKAHLESNTLPEQRLRLFRADFSFISAPPRSSQAQWEDLVNASKTCTRSDREQPQPQNPNVSYFPAAAFLTASEGYRGRFFSDSNPFCFLILFSSSI